MVETDRKALADAVEHMNCNCGENECFTPKEISAAASALREEGEPEKLRDALEWCARQMWEGYAIEGYDFQDEMVKRGLMVEVPADENFRDVWGADEMYVMAWSPLADPDRHPHTEEPEND